ncbi:MAG: hypothetical protein Kow0037_18580 [Calditrichia bacterium]
MNFKYLWTFMLCLLVLGAPRLRGQTLELQVKAAFIEKFTHFIEWPPLSQNKTYSDTFRVLILGESPLTPLIEANFKKSPPPSFKHFLIVKGNEVEVNDYYHLIYISPSFKVKLEEVLSITAGKPILTIGDTEGYGQRGVIINLYKAGETIRFEVNYQSLQRSSLNVSSRLLKLARILNWSEVP